MFDLLFSPLPASFQVNGEGPVPLVAQAVPGGGELNRSGSAAPGPLVVDYHPVESLPGGLNQVPVFNSNSPEVISREGILLSTFPRSGKAFPQAHLEQAIAGRFDIFTHHISRPAGASQTLYQGLLISNPSGQTRTVTVLQGLSYLNSEDAPFRELLPFIEDPNGSVYSGPGSRLSGDLLRGKNQTNLFPRQLRIPPYSMGILFSLPIPPSSSRSTYLRLESDGGVYLANLAKYEVSDRLERVIQENVPSPSAPGTFERSVKLVTTDIVRPPTVDEWRYLLTQGKLVSPRDLAPFPIANSDDIIYGRVAGVSLGSEWRATFSDRPNGPYFTIPAPGSGISFPISTTTTGTFNTDQIQSAPMVVRYGDTALKSHGNYLVHYDFSFPLFNPTEEPQRVTLTFQTPIKQNQHSDRLTFFANPPNQIFFRGTVRLQYPDASGELVEKYIHLVQRRGEQGQPLAEIVIPPGGQRTAKLDFFYPPDATPPQVITVKTVAPDTPEISP